MINKKEVERYLGYGKNIPDERTTELIEECIRQIEKIAQPRSIYRIFDLKLKEAEKGADQYHRTHPSDCGRSICGHRSGGNEDAEQKSGKKLKRL